MDCTSYLHHGSPLAIASYMYMYMYICSLQYLHIPANMLELVIMMHAYQGSGERE